ncbi:MAG: HAD-IB family phosphatase [Candidatus Helarchaeota archaeon]|nr:HAD-IB family phosphatase [Candidatus Helarchaeota archaeon]
MEFKLIIFDVDGTLTKENNSWKLIHTSLNVFEQAKTHRELFFNKGISYQKWADLDVGLWKNVHVSRIEKILNKVPLIEGISETLSILKKKDLKTSLLSSGISIFADKLKERFGFDYSIANKVIINEKGYLTGEVICNVAYNNKDKAINGLLKKLNITFQECIAVGDNENDVNLFKKVGLSIALNPQSSNVSEVADITVTSTDLRKILNYIP